MRSTYRQCAATTTLTMEEWEWLDDVPDQVGAVPDEARCLLEEHHPGAHWAFGQRSEEDMVCTAMYWLMWGEGPRGIVRTGEECIESVPSGPFPDDCEYCGLPRQHPGRHGFEFTDTPAAAPTLRVVEQLD